MITKTSLKHPTMQIKIKSIRVQAMMGLVGKLYNSKGKLIMLSVMHANEFEASVYLVEYDTEGKPQVGENVTEMVLKACPYDVVPAKKSFFQKAKEAVLKASENLKHNLATNIQTYVVGSSIATFALAL